MLKHHSQIRAARAKRFTVQVRQARTEEAHQIAKIFFSGRDGSLYVDFPYFEHRDGLVCRATLTPGATEVSLVEGGKVTSHRVKYAHHRDGEAHFSQTGKVLTQVRKPSVPLNRYSGHIFTIQLHEA
jgi:hypothetical protein